MVDFPALARTAKVGSDTPKGLSLSVHWVVAATLMRIWSVSVHRCALLLMLVQQVTNAILKVWAGLSPTACTSTDSASPEHCVPAIRLHWVRLSSACDSQENQAGFAATWSKAAIDSRVWPAVQMHCGVMQIVSADRLALFCGDIQPVLFSP